MIQCAGRLEALGISPIAERQKERRRYRQRQRQIETEIDSELKGAVILGLGCSRMPLP